MQVRIAQPAGYAWVGALHGRSQICVLVIAEGTRATQRSRATFCFAGSIISKCRYQGRKRSSSSVVLVTKLCVTSSLCPILTHHSRTMQTEQMGLFLCHHFTYASWAFPL